MCTGIKIDYKDGCVMGRTMDYEVPLDYNIIYLPNNYHFCDDLMCQPVHTKYRTLGLCFANHDPLKDGINEHGLMGITNEFSGFNLYHNEVKKEKFNISSLDYLTYALASYKSVEELVLDLPNIHMSTKDYQGNKVICPDFHFMFVDATQRCVVIEPKRQQLICYENPYDVMTNSPGFETQVRRLKQLIDLDNIEDFNSAKDLPGGYDPISRFIKAFYLTKMNIKANNSKEALAYTYNILSAMAMPNGFVRNRKYDYTTYTRYICAYDTKDKLLTVKSDTNPTVYQLGFDDIEDEDKRQEFFLDKELVLNNIKKQ